MIWIFALSSRLWSIHPQVSLPRLEGIHASRRLREEGTKHALTGTWAAKCRGAAPLVWPGAGGVVGVRWWRWEYHLGRLDGGSENLSWWLVSTNGLHKERFDDKQWKSIAGRVSTGQLTCWGCISSQNKCTEISCSHYPNNSCMVSLKLKYNWSRSPLPQRRYAKYVDDANEILYQQLQLNTILQWE